MTNIRFPLKMPTSGHPNPYTIDFDFLPNPLVSWNELNVTQRNNLYLTNIQINDTDIESYRIQHIYPNGKVYFIIDDEFNDSIPQIAVDILYDNFTNDINGTWIHVAEINDIKLLRNAAQTCFIPTAIVYESVTLTPLIILKIKTYLSNQFNVSKIFGHDIELLDKIKDFLNGKIRIKLNDTDINSGDFTMPTVRIIENTIELKLGGIMMDGNGIEKDTILGLVSLLKRNRTNGMLFDPESHDTQRMIVACPLNTFLASTLFLNNEDNHPYKALIDINNPNAITRHIWDAVVFSKNNPSSLSRARFDLHSNNRSIKVQNDNYEFPLHKSGIFYYPNLHNKTIMLENKNNNSYFNLYTISNGQLTEGSSIQLTSNLKKNNYYSIGYGSIPEGIENTNNTTNYFGVEPIIDNLSVFYEKLSHNHFFTLTSAGTFALSMGFLAESIANYFVVQGNTILDYYEGNAYNRNILNKNSIELYDIFIATAVYLFVPSDYVPFGYGLISDYSNYLSKISGNLKNVCDSILRKYNEDSFLRTHEDHDDFDSRWGWKSFEKEFDGGHKHHFIFNADSKSLIVFGPIYENLMPNKYGGEDSKIDVIYNQKGREFYLWALFDYNPQMVYNKIKELIVENETIQ